jgi:peptidoglycan/LPS O-acetylase OafA/YrhL
MTALATSDLQAPARPRPSTSALPAHIPALDGIRGLAVLLVLYCHSTFIEPGGIFGKVLLASSRISWAGVDLFFVLSGFLITGILFDAKGKQYFFRNFYARRTVRIFPLYYAFLVLALLVFPMFVSFNWHLSRHHGDFPAAQWPYWLYLSNFYQSFHPTEHIVFVSWSLAIEEQFYLAWPLVVFLFDRKTLLKITVAMFVGSLLLRIGVTGLMGHWLASRGIESWKIANNFTICRLDGLAAGAWIALMIRGDSRFTISSLVKPAKLLGPLAALVMLGIVGIAYAEGWRGGIGQSPGYVLVGYTALAIMFGALLVVAVAADRDSVLGRLFSGRVLTVFGKYSYAVYLLHFPVNLILKDFAFDPSKGTTNGRQLALQALFYLLSGTCVLALSWVSWNVLEKHCLKLKDFFPMSPKPLPAPPRNVADLDHHAGNVARPAA